jgi:hypothetical protein
MQSHNHASCHKIISFTIPKAWLYDIQIIAYSFVEKIAGEGGLVRKMRMMRKMGKMRIRLRS